MRRRALLRAAGVGVGTLALPSIGQSVTARGRSGTAGYAEAARWSPLDADEKWSDTHPFTRILHDVYVQGDYAYLAYWDAGTFVVDVSDPTDPSFVSRVGEYSYDELVELSNDRERLQSAYGEAPGNAHYVTVNEDATVMGVGAEGWDDPSTDARGPGGIDLYDVSDVADPERKATIEPPEAADETRQGTWVTSHNFDIVGDRLYSSWYQAGVKIHDVSDPANPEQLAWWRKPDEAVFWTAQVAKPGEFFVASSYGVKGATPGLYTFPDRAGEQADPPSLGDPSTTTTGSEGSVSASGASPAGAAPYEPIGFLEVEGAAEAVVGDDGETAYLAVHDGFAVVDVSDPASPELLAERRGLMADREAGPLQSILDVKVDGDVLVVAGPAQRGRLHGFLTYDVSDPANPEQRGTFFETRTRNHNVFVQDEYVYHTGNDNRRNPLVIVDVSNPASSSTSETTTQATDATTTTTTETTARTTETTTTSTATPTTTTESQSMPGFGVGAAIGGLGLGALGLRRYLGEDEE